MAIINTYPTATPKEADLLIGTQVKDDTIEENSTKTFSLSSIGSLLITSNDITTGSGTTNTLPVWTDGPNGVVGDSLITQTTSPDIVTIGSGFIVSPNSITALEITQGAGKALVTISDNLKVDGTYYDSASDEGADGDVLLAKGVPGDMSTRWTSLEDAGITSGIKTIQVTVTDAEIRTLGTVPVEIIPSIANASIQIIGLTTQNIGNGSFTDAYDWSSSGDGVFFGTGFSSTQHKVEIPNSYLPEGGASTAADIYIAGVTPGGMRIGSAVRLSTTTGVDPSIPIGQSPSAEMVVNVTYRVIPIT